MKKGILNSKRPRCLKGVMGIATIYVIGLIVIMLQLRSIQWP